MTLLDIFGHVYLFSLLHIEICEIISAIGITNTQIELFLTLLSCIYNTTISIKTNRSITWTLPMMSPALTS